jgi:hypothetical protein
MLSIAINHNMWLTRDQRYSLHGGENLEIIGVSVPVWVSGDKVTSEPAKEIFCKYYLKNSNTECPIQILKDGYEITLPLKQDAVLDLTDDLWRDLNINNPNKLEELYKNLPKVFNSKNLLDVKDGGSKYLNFREHNKMKMNNDPINFIHFVNIMDIENLIESFV